MGSIFILNWNPSKWYWDEIEYAQGTTERAESRPASGGWSLGCRTHGVAPGDRTFLLRQHIDRGIVARGRFTSNVFQAPHWDRLQGSHTRVAPDAAERLDQFRGEHTGLEPFLGPDDVPEFGTHRKGDVEQIPVNRYERRPQARAACITAHGTTCSICGFDFAATYGELAEGYIDVDHLTERSKLGEGAESDPECDLRPVNPTATQCSSTAAKHLPSKNCCDGSSSVAGALRVVRANSITSQACHLSPASVGTRDE